MLIVIFIIGVLFLFLAVISFIYPGLMVKLINRLEIKWSVDKELFLNFQLARIVIGAIFLLAAGVLFYASHSMTK